MQETNNQTLKKEIAGSTDPVISIEDLPQGMSDQAFQEQWIAIEDAIDQRFGENISPKLKSIAISDIERDPSNITGILSAIREVPSHEESGSYTNKRDMPGGPPKQKTAAQMELHGLNIKALPLKERLAFWFGLRDLDSDEVALERVNQKTLELKSRKQEKDLAKAATRNIVSKPETDDLEDIPLPIIRPSKKSEIQSTTNKDQTNDKKSVTPINQKPAEVTQSGNTIYYKF